MYMLIVDRDGIRQKSEPMLNSHHLFEDGIGSAR